MAIILFYGLGLNCISESIYEAARVDGASEWKCFTKITLPNLKTTLYTVSVLSLLNSFKVFERLILLVEIIQIKVCMFCNIYLIIGLEIYPLGRCQQDRLLWP